MAAERPSPIRSIATRTGDDGTTGLLYGQRVPKNHPQIEAVGALDELNTAIGLAKASLPTYAQANRDTLTTLQKDLVTLMGEISCAESDAARYEGSSFAKLTAAELTRLDDAVAQIEARQPRFDGWATPGANLHAATFELARTAARRAERHLVGLPGQGKNVRPLLLHYINRLSDLLWLLAREAEAD